MQPAIQVRSLLFLVAMPLVFTIFMGFAYRAGSDPADQDDRIPLALVDPQPDEDLNTLLAQRLMESQVVALTPMAEAPALDALQSGEVAGVLLVPPDFNRLGMVGEPVQLQLVAAAGSLEAQSLYQVLRVPVSQLMSAVEISREAVDDLPGADPKKEQAAALDLAWDLWEAENQPDLVRAEQAAPPTSEDWTGGNPYNQASPGILVQFAIIGLITSAQVLVLERQTHTLQRMRTTDLQPWEIIAGHVLAMFALVFLQILLLVIFGQLVLGVDYLHAPLSTLLVSLALSLWVAAMGLLIGLLAKEEQQVILYSMIAMFVFSSLGGTWFPLEASGGMFAAIGRLLPSAWAMTGYQNILIRGLGLASAWKPALVLLAYALGFFALSAWRLRKMDL